MKNIFKSIFFAGVTGLATLTACSDFLDQSSPSELTPDNVYTNETNTQQALNRVYAGLVLDHTYGSRLPLNFGMNNDVEIVDALDAESVVAVRERGLCNYNPVNWSNLNNNWSEMFEIIENANLVIEGIRSTEYQENENLCHYLGEALTLRAMIFYDLIKNYGDVPMKMESTKTDGSNIYLGKTDRDDIMDSLLIDLEEAAGLLPWAGESGYTSERCTKGFAYGLAARIALFEAGYSIRETRKEGYVDLAERREGQEGYSDGTYPTMRPGDDKRRELYEHALACLDAVIANGPHRLNPSYENEWYLSNQLTLDQTYNENIFEVAHGLNYSGEMGYTAGIRINPTSSYFGYQNSSGKVKLTAPYFMSFDHADLRRDVTCAPYELNTAASTQTMKNAPWGIYVAKWDPRKMTDAWRNMNLGVETKTGYGINWIVMRYSDILLMYAEAVNELQGPDGAGTCGMTARKALTEVRKRAFPTEAQAEKVDQYVAALNGKEDFFNAIVDERAWEFGGEAIRKYDLIRWGLLIDKTVEMLDSYRNAIQNDEYVRELYYQVDPDAEEWYRVDYSTVCWYEIPTELEDMNDQELAAAGWESTGFWGNVKKDDVIPENNSSYNALNYISNGLVNYDKNSGFQGPANVVNRHVFPIGGTTINDSNGHLQNSYDFPF